MRRVKMFTILVLCLGLVSNASASLVAHYELATNFNDSSGNGLHGTPMGGASILSDPERGNVLSLNGAGQYVDCTNNALFNITEAITVACWIKVNSFDVEWQSVVAKGNSAWRLSRDGTQDDLEFACTGLSGNWKVLGYKNVNDGKWHHVAGVYDGSEISLYVDGVLDDSLAASGTIDTTTHQVWLGGNVERLGREWNGLLDDVRIYDHALSAAEIAGLTGKMGTAYTYQGRLLDGNNPADGTYDFEFKLYSDPGIGLQEGITVEVNDLDVIDGYFTAELDFGSDVFSGDGRWLDISVR
ncbi:MAG: LamG domain-containing protein, partial [Planctomycetota bacterium]